MKQSNRKGSRRWQRRRQMDVRIMLDIEMDKYISEMCEFLDQTPQPSDLAVQAKFMVIRDRWMELCTKHKTSEYTKFRFNREFKTIWEKRYRRPQDPRSQESEGENQPQS